MEGFTGPPPTENAIENRLCDGLGLLVPDGLQNDIFLIGVNCRKLIFVVMMHWSVDGLEQ
jgi:hypothetical protein